MLAGNARLNRQQTSLTGSASRCICSTVSAP
jgi:hypothetical protein